MRKINTTVYTSPIGELLIGETDDKLCLCDWLHRKMRNTINQRIKSYFEAEFHTERTSKLQTVINQLEEYFHNKRTAFDLELTFAGSAFQKRVWEELYGIPYGETMSYLDLSRKLGDEKAIRAVASANGANAISIIVPCHRIIGSKGELTGYAGGLKAKEYLLKLEGSLDKNQLKLF